MQKEKDKIKLETKEKYIQKGKESSEQSSGEFEDISKDSDSQSEEDPPKRDFKS